MSTVGIKIKTPGQKNISSTENIDFKKLLAEENIRAKEGRSRDNGGCSIAPKDLADSLPKGV
jgi:hypothetical protein